MGAWNVRRFWDAVRTAGHLASVASFFILMGFLWLVYDAVRNPDAELFPPPLRYLDAQVGPMGELSYRPDRPAYCPGDTVTWTSNAYNVRSTAAVVSYYLQSEHPYRFEGADAARLEGEYPGPKKEIVSLWHGAGDTFHTRRGTYIGGARSFVIPERAELAGGNDLKALSPMRLYIEIDAPFSSGAGYHLEWVIGEDCFARTR